VLAVRRALAVPDSVVLPVSHSGGAFAGTPRLVDAFKHALGVMRPAFDCRLPLFPPVIGASLYAARLAGQALNAEALTNLRGQCATADLPQ
jgi:hypothetical protein